MRIIPFILSIFFYSFTIAQSVNQINDSIVEFIECEPSFPGGYSAMHLFIQDNFDFSDIDSNKFDTGRIYITFYIEIDGSISEIDILNNERESIKVQNANPISSMPNWIPACDGKGPIRDKVYIPINF